MNQFPWREAIAAAIFLVSMAVVVMRPKGMHEAATTLIGALAMLLSGVLSIQDALTTVTSQWNLFLFFIGLMLVSGLVEAAGFFDAAAALAIVTARGSGRLLLLNVFVIGAVITTFLSNDATALILTPVVYSVTTRLRLPPVPYLLATTFVADTASMMLPVSNPINVLVSDHAGITLRVYASHLLGASLMAVSVNVLLFMVMFRHETHHSFQIDWRAVMNEAVADRHLFRLTAVGAAIVATLYLLASTFRFPLGVVAVGGAALLTTCAFVARNLNWRRVLAHFSLPLLLYVGGLLVLVRGVESVGLTDVAVGWLTRVSQGPIGSVTAGLLGGALGANLINNVPATLVLLSGSGGRQLPFLFGVLAGADLGPNLTPVGSLSTMLWLVIVRRHGVQISSMQYMKTGVLITPLLLAAAGIAIAVTFR